MARIEVDCERIRRNAEAVVAMCAARGIEVAGVVKGCCGEPAVARAMLAGGVAQLADSRLPNVRRLREAGIESDVLLLRLPAPSEVDAVVALTQFSLNSEVDVVRALSRAAQEQGKRHGVILMIEAGDRREGVMPEDAVAVARDMANLPNIDLVGVGSNLNCIGGVLCTAENQQLLVDAADRIERDLGISLRWVSGGHTGNLPSVDRGDVAPRINHLRVGEAILIGTRTVHLLRAASPAPGCLHGLRRGHRAQDQAFPSGGAHWARRLYERPAMGGSRASQASHTGDWRTRSADHRPAAAAPWCFPRRCEL